MDRHAGVILAEVAFLLMLISGIWFVSSIRPVVRQP
jgi:hypothetical protein